MRSLILALAVAAMAVSSGCCLNSNGSGCSASDGCPGGLLGRSGCRLGNCRFLGGGGCKLGNGRLLSGRRDEGLGLGVFETGSSCSSCDSGDCGGNGCGGRLGGHVVNLRDRRLARRADAQSYDVTGMVDGSAAGGCGLASCGQGGGGCGHGCGLRGGLGSHGLGGHGLGGRGLGNHLPGRIIAARTAQVDAYGGQIPHTDPALGPPGGAGGFTPTYQYPYYTTRGPRDFLNGNPPSIGPR